MKTWKVFCALVLCAVAITSLCFCGGGDSSPPPALVTNTKYNASAAAGDYIKLTVDLSDGTYSYKNVTTGRNETGTVTEDPTTKELTFTATTSTGGGSGDGSATELITGFVAPNTGIVLLANNTGASDITSMVFGVPYRNHSLSELINLVPAGSSADYILMQFRIDDGGFEIGYADIMENQAYTDEPDLNNDGSVVDTINGAPLYAEVYSTVAGVVDPSNGLPYTIFSEDIINPTDPLASQIPFTEAAPDGSHLIVRAWEDINVMTIVDNKTFFNSTFDKVIIDSEFGNSILLERSGDSSWSADYEGTYYAVEYNGQGTLGGTDTPTSQGTLVFEISNDGSANGLLSVRGDPDYQDITLSSFQDMESAGLLGEVVSPWPVDAPPLNGVFGFTVSPEDPLDPNDLGGEVFVIFSDNTLFFVSAELTGPRDSSGGDLHNRPAAYTYSYGGGLRIQ